MELSSARKQTAASCRGHLFNSGSGYCLQTIDIGHPEYAAVLVADTAFWSIIKKECLGQVFTSGEIFSKLKKYSSRMKEEIHTLRFNLKPSAVYFNPTEICNLNCSYCYIPEEIRKEGANMSADQLEKSLHILKEYFLSTLPSGRKPLIVFHGSEPLINKKVLFQSIEKHIHEFEFGIQTNAVLLEKEDFKFLSSYNVAIGISLDGHNSLIADKYRKDWSSKGVFKKVLEIVKMAKGYPLFNVICTVTNGNVKSLTKIIEFFHQHHIENCLINQVRCTLDGGKKSKPDDAIMAQMFIDALKRSYELFQQTGRKIIIGNFANILLSIIAPSARRLMCDINPCGAGRCFFSVSAKGDVYPCSEFIGLPRFKGGNLFKDTLSKILLSEPFSIVTDRRIENIAPCKQCAIRHFCGAPCPAEAYQLHGTMQSPGAFCEFYEHQVRYAFRLIADKKESAYLWDNWDKNTTEMFRF